MIVDLMDDEVKAIRYVIALFHGEFGETNMVPSKEDLDKEESSMDAFYAAMDTLLAKGLRLKGCGE